MDAFMVVATFKPGTAMEEVLAVVEAEQARVAELRAAGQIGEIYLAAAARQTVFLEAFGSDVDDVDAAVQTLPMARWWELDIFPLNAPATSGVDA